MTTPELTHQILRTEPSPRWVRAQIGDEYIVDSKRALLVWEHDKYPTYFFHRDDVRSDLLSESGRTKSRVFWDLAVAGHSIARAAYGYLDQPDLQDYLTLPWHKVDRWFEEEEEVFVHARDPYKRIDVMPSSRHVKVVIDGVTVADTRRP